MGEGLGAGQGIVRLKEIRKGNCDSEGEGRGWRSVTARQAPCPTPYILPASRQLHSATAPAGQDRLPLSRLTEHVHDLLASALRPCGDREQQDSPGRCPERAGTEGRPRTHLGEQGTQSSLLDFACRRTRPLTFLPHGQDFSHAQVPTQARVPGDSLKEKASRPSQPSPPVPRTLPGLHTPAPTQSPRLWAHLRSVQRQRPARSGNPNTRRSELRPLLRPAQAGMGGGGRIWSRGSGKVIGAPGDCSKPAGRGVRAAGGGGGTRGVEPQRCRDTGRGRGKGKRQKTRKRWGWRGRDSEKGMERWRDRLKEGAKRARGGTRKKRGLEGRERRRLRGKEKGPGRQKEGEKSRERQRGI